MSLPPLRIRYLLGDDVAAVADDPRARALLSPEEAVRARRFRVPTDARGFVAGRVLARAMLAEAYGRAPAEVAFHTDARGRPHVAAAGLMPLPFSITHTPGLVGCAVASGGAVGLDAEYTGRTTDVERLARRYLATAERTYLDALPPEGRRHGFFVVWTLKEAFLKARGEGISVPLSSFAVHPSSSPPGLTCDAGMDADPAAWRLDWLPLGPEHVLAWARQGADADGAFGGPERVTASPLMDGMGS